MRLRVLQRFTPTGPRQPHPPVMFAPGPEVGTYIPFRNSDPNLPHSVFGAATQDSPDVQAQQVYSHDQLKILVEQGREVVIAQIDTQPEEMALAKVEDSGSFPSVREEIRDLVVGAYASALARGRNQRMGRSG